MTCKPRLPRPAVVQPSDPSIRYIPLTHGFVATVDAAEYDSLMQWNWYAIKRDASTVVYAGTGYYIVKRCIVMHKLIMGIDDPRQVDHVDGDGLNNRRSNLRWATHGQNMLNRMAQRNNKSGYKGVMFRRGGNFTRPWEARICADGVRVYCGFFKTPENAAIAYNLKALEMHGEFAKLNLAPSAEGKEQNG